MTTEFLVIRVHHTLVNMSLFLAHTPVKPTEQGLDEVKFY